LGDGEIAKQVEESMLHVVSDQAIKENMEVDWSNRIFWNMYRSRAISYTRIFAVRMDMSKTQKSGQLN